LVEGQDVTARFLVLASADMQFVYCKGNRGYSARIRETRLYQVFGVCMAKQKRYTLIFLAVALVLLLVGAGCATPDSLKIPEKGSAPADQDKVVQEPFKASLQVGLLPASSQDEKQPGSMALDSNQDNVRVSAIGSGLSEAEAKNDALASLGSILYSQVSSFVETSKKETEAAGVFVDSKASFSQEIKIASDLPLLGATFPTALHTSYDAKRKALVYEIEAVLDSATSLFLYESELETVGQKITLAEDNLPKAKDSLEKEEQLNLLLGYYTQFEKLGYVARALGSTTIPELRQSKYSLALQLMQQSNVIDSYEKAARVLAKAVTQKGVYVYPAKLNGSGGVTEFAEQLSYALQNELGSKAFSSPFEASYFLLGTYTLKDEGKGGIYVTYRLEDRFNNVLSSSLVQLLPLVYEGQQLVPVAYDFQKQLERGNAVDTGFTVDIRINGKKEYLTFEAGDELILEVKANSPCYFYVVGYVFNELDERFSYIFPLDFAAVGKDRFVYRVSPQEVNKWIIINPTYKGEVLSLDVVEPYGVELLQVYASTEKEYQKFLETVPGFKETKDYYVISDNPEDGLTLTRALNVKKKSELAASETKQSEASVSFSSSRK
jgi:hypothetical protein